MERQEVLAFFEQEVEKTEDLHLFPPLRDRTISVMLHDEEDDYSTRLDYENSEIIVKYNEEE